MSVALITHAACRLHNMGQGHPEQPARLNAIEDQLHGRRLYDFLIHHDAPRASVEQLARVHPRDHIERISAKSPAEGLTFLDPDTAMCPDTLEAALRAAGAQGPLGSKRFYLEGQRRRHSACSFSRRRPISTRPYSTLRGSASSGRK